MILAEIPDTFAIHPVSRMVMIHFVASSKITVIPAFLPSTLPALVPPRLASYIVIIIKHFTNDWSQKVLNHIDNLLTNR